MTNLALGGASVSESAICLLLQHDKIDDFLLVLKVYFIAHSGFGAHLFKSRVFDQGRVSESQHKDRGIPIPTTGPRTVTMAKQVAIVAALCVVLALASVSEARLSWSWKGLVGGAPATRRALRSRSND